MGVPISSLPAASSLTGDEVFPIVQGGSTKQATLNDIPYTPTGTGAVTTTVQSKLQEVVSVKDFGAAGDGVTDDASAIEAAIDAAQAVHFTAGTYYVENGCSSVIGSNKTITFDPGVKIVSGSPASSASSIFEFTGVADNFRIIGNGVEIYYSDTPTVRTGHTVSITGETITNLEISGLNVLNSANMAISVFCGNLNTVASGSKNIYIHDCQVMNTLGDGVHVENADSGVRISNIYGQSNSDDVVAVINYTGSGSSPTHPTTTKNVCITNIVANDVVTSTVSAAGIENFVIDNIVETAKSGASPFTIKFTHAAGYTVGNSFGSIDNISTTGAEKIVVLDTPSGGTAHNKNIRFGKIVGKNVSGVALHLSNAGTSTDGKLCNIEFDNVEISGSGSSSAPAYISQTKNVRIVSLHADGCAIGGQAANNAGLSWGRINLQGFQSSTSYALNINTNTSIFPGQLDIDASNCSSGLIFQSNSGIDHRGLWKVANATTNYTFGSNSSVSGFFDVVDGVSYRASVTAGSTEDISYARPVPSGASYTPLVTVATNNGLRWGVKNMLNDKMTMLWTDSQSVVYVNYCIYVKAA